MSFKSKLLAAATTLTLVGGAGAAGVLTAGAAHAATPSCGPACADIFSEQFGSPLTGHPGFLMDSYKQGIAVGTPIILFRESNSDPAEDFNFAAQGSVADFLAAGLVSSSLALHYGCIPKVNFPDCASASADLEAYEFEYAPFGAPTGECVGVAATAVSGEKVTLEPCGVSGKTIWVVDLIDNHGAVPFGLISAPLINGSDTNFSHPFVLTYPGGGYPTDRPRPVMFVSNLTGHQDGVLTSTTDVNSDQLWAAFFGPVQA